ncbi:coenzyme A pyrophosphatase [Marinobacterium aestuarii]|uniref:Coenzyme A pyrophosphatase n=1 Tax=Marinobacterium aestuarii TaxID=1821621 RepID=A0A1A9EV49_9GAMM|nr:CoA pyrophosphatase [Marinobacterium aestuarii]ANG61439.1 coenzyme A pyrophosphatase [Marinobacterium aestuarii]
MLELLRRRLADYRPRRLLSERPNASVLIALTDEVEPHVILTRRASHLSTHRGEVAFPGGKQDDTDPDLLYTALREAQEEIGLEPGLVEVLGPLGQVMSKHQLQVTPWVGIVPQDVMLTPSPAELESLFRVPLSFFMEDRRQRTDIVRFRGMTHYVPAYEYNGYVIWGLTAYMLVELLNVGFDAGIPMKPRPEHEPGGY